MTRRNLITFGLSITALLAVLLAFGMTMSTAHAANTFVDDFESGWSNWSSLSGDTMFSGSNTFSSGSGVCHTGACVGIAPSPSGNRTRKYLPIVGGASTQGSFSIWINGNRNAGASFPSNSSIEVCDTNNCSEFGSNPFGFNPYTQDGTWHQNTYAWQKPSTYVEFCHLTDDTDLTHCSWSSNGLTYSDIESMSFWVQNTSNGTDFGTPGWYLYLDDLNSITAPIVDTSTRITAIVPQPDTTVGTSTNFSFGGKGYVNIDDWTEDTVLYIRYNQQTGQGKRGNGPINQHGDFTIPITASGDFDLSSTTSLTNSGVYIGYIAIQKPRFSLFGFNFFTQTLAANTWIFTAATSTQTELDATVLLLSTTGAGQNLASTTLATSELQSCQNFLSGSTTECIISMFVPSGEQLTGAAGVMNTALSNNLPFSMFWEPYTALKNITGSTTPVAGTDVQVNMHNTFIQGTTTIFSWSDARDTVQATISDTAVTYIVYVEWIIFGLYCIWRITRILA